MPALSAHWLLIAQQRLPLKKMDVAHRSNYCMRVSALYNHITGTKYLAMLGVSTLWYNCSINTMKRKRTTEEPQGSFRLIWDGKNISRFQITINRVIIFISMCIIKYNYISVSGRVKLLAPATALQKSVCPHLSDKRKGQMSGTGGVAGRSFASAMMCSKVMSVCVQTSTTHTSCGVPLWLCATAAVALVGVRRRTWTTIGSRLMASTTASSWSTLEKSRAFTWGTRRKNH